MNIIFFSGSDFTLPLLQELRQHTSNLKLVTNPDTILRNKTQTNKLKEWAEKNSVPVWQPGALRKTPASESESQLNDYDLAIVASYGQIIPESVIKLFPLGMVNWHPSLLPAYRGPSPVQQAILDGVATTGLTWIEMNDKMDEGDIILQKPIALTPDSTFASVIDNAITTGKDTLSDVLHKVVLHRQGSYPYTPQNSAEATCTHLIKKSDSFTDPTSTTGEEFARKFRAYSTFPKMTVQDSYYGLVRIDGIGKIFADIDPQQHRQGGFIQCLIEEKKVTLLACKNSYIEVTKITLSNGKNIDFSGVVFDSQEETSQI